MKHGDLSNRTAPILAFNIDTLLFKNEVLKEEGIKEKILNLLTLQILKEQNDYFNRKPNEGNLKLIKTIWESTDFHIYFVTFKPFVKEIDKFLYEDMQFLYYNRVIGFPDLTYVPPLLQTRYSLFVDGSYDNVNALGNGAIHISELPKYLNGSI